MRIDTYRCVWLTLYLLGLMPLPVYWRMQSCPAPATYSAASRTGIGPSSTGNPSSRRIDLW